MIAVLLSLKTLELRARRDAFVVFFLGFFTMLTNFFFSQSLLTAAAMLVALMGLLTALVNTHMPVGKPPLREAARMAAVMALLGAPIMLVLFMLFPRLAPLWGIPSDAMAGRSGLSGNMQVGTIASLALDDSVACASASTVRRRASRSCISAGRCCPPWTGANGACCARVSPSDCRTAGPAGQRGTGGLPGHDGAEQPQLDPDPGRGTGTASVPGARHAHDRRSCSGPACSRCPT
jgi:hypothetical protein